MLFVFQKNVGEALISVEDLTKVGTTKETFEVALHIRGARFHAFHTNGQIGHILGLQKLRWPRAPRPLNSSLCAVKHSLASWHGHLSALHTNDDNPGLNRRRCNLN